MPPHLDQPRQYTYECGQSSVQRVHTYPCAANEGDGDRNYLRGSLDHLEDEKVRISSRRKMPAILLHHDQSMIEPESVIVRVKDGMVGERGHASPHCLFIVVVRHVVNNLAVWMGVAKKEKKR